jgi:aspartyl-tRNA(Asn)/glutamyl-tRNA(Gln) amidotransferase subunit B
MMQSEDIYSKYEPVIGLEIHAQLLTKSKAYSSDRNEFGADPNTLISVITLGHPGVLPKHNKEAVRKAVMLGVAMNCEIREYNYYARKNYFYADLPKGYQITQDKTPICNKGHLDIKLKEGGIKKIGITRIHMEEDAGKSMHDQDVYHSLIDLNRAGVPLVEIVSEPDLRNGDEAYAYISEVRKIVRYLEICDGNMEEGSLRCDANISVRIKGAKEFGTKVEVKNMNSISNVKRAIDVEIKRQIELIEEGGTVVSETRGYDANKNETFSQRSKEAANDYRYFPEPDLPPFTVTSQQVGEIVHKMPALPESLFRLFTSEYKLSEYDAHVLIEDKETAMYFQELLKHTSNYKAAANWVMVAIRGYLNENALEISKFMLGPEKIAGIIQMIDEGKISHSIASQKLFPAMLEAPSSNAFDIAQKLNLVMQSDSSELEKIIGEVIAKYPDKVAEYKSGKKGLLGLFMGDVMKATKGKADPKVANSILVKALEG